MSRGFRFMLSVFIFLLGGVNSVFAVNHHIKTKAPCTSSQHVEKIRSPRVGDGNLCNPAIEINRFSEKKNDFLSIEDDDEELSFSRKYVLLEKDVLTISYTPVPDYRDSNFTIPLPFCGHLSYTASNTYLLQRVLRL
jgi:hypothetical protein